MEIIDLNGRKGLVVGLANEHSLMLASDYASAVTGEVVHVDAGSTSLG